jgi:hypothetical protein
MTGRIKIISYSQFLKVVFQLAIGPWQNSNTGNKATAVGNRINVRKEGRLTHLKKPAAPGKERRADAEEIGSLLGLIAIIWTNL